MSSTSRSVRVDVQRELDRLTSLEGIERVPGVVLSVFDGEEVHHWASGRAGAPRDPAMTADTLFRIASPAAAPDGTVVLPSERSAGRFRRW